MPTWTEYEGEKPEQKPAITILGRDGSAILNPALIERTKLTKPFRYRVHIDPASHLVRLEIVKTGGFLSSKSLKAPRVPAVAKALAKYGYPTDRRAHLPLVDGEDLPKWCFDLKEIAPAVVETAIEKIAEAVKEEWSAGPPEMLASKPVTPSEPDSLEAVVTDPPFADRMAEQIDSETEGSGSLAEDAAAVETGIPVTDWTKHPEYRDMSKAEPKAKRVRCLELQRLGFMYKEIVHLACIPIGTLPMLIAQAKDEEAKVIAGHQHGSVVRLGKAKQEPPIPPKAAKPKREGVDKTPEPPEEKLEEPKPLSPARIAEVVVLAGCGKGPDQISKILTAPIGFVQRAFERYGDEIGAIRSARTQLAKDQLCAFVRRELKTYGTLPRERKSA